MLILYTQDCFNISSSSPSSPSSPSSSSSSFEMVAVPIAAGNLILILPYHQLYVVKAVETSFVAFKVSLKWNSWIEYLREKILYHSDLEVNLANVIDGDDDDATIEDDSLSFLFPCKVLFSSTKSESIT